MDTYDKKQVVMINTKKKITRQRNRLYDSSFKMLQEDVKVHIGVKQELERAGIQFKRPNKDIVVVEQKNTMD